MRSSRVVKHKRVVEQCHGSNRAAYVRAKNKSFELHTKQRKSWKAKGVHLSSRSIVALSMKVNGWLVKTLLLANRAVLTTKGQSSRNKAVSDIITVNHVFTPRSPRYFASFIRKHLVAILRYHTEKYHVSAATELNRILDVGEF